jgi:hypothetical protein
MLRPDKSVPNIMRRVGVPLGKATEALRHLSNDGCYIVRGDEPNRDQVIHMTLQPGPRPMFWCLRTRSA